MPLASAALIHEARLLAEKMPKSQDEFEIFFDNFSGQSYWDIAVCEEYGHKQLTDPQTFAAAVIEEMREMYRQECEA